jgi:uncharacterized protein (DUF58 family)
VVNLADGDRVEVSLHVPLQGRGWYHPGRLLLESTYPLGLLRCWTWIDLDLPALVYPRPVAGPDPRLLPSGSPGGQGAPRPGNDDLLGFRDYRPGDSLRQVHWKGLARGQALQTRINSAYAERSQWLDWDQFPEDGLELRLSHLCHRALECERSGEAYGLRLPGTVIAPGRGDKHRDAVLKALALFRPGGADEI